MNDTILATVTDHNPVNLAGLTVFIASLILRSQQFGRIVVLSPVDTIPKPLLHWLSSQGVENVQYEMRPLEDPYTVKFLLRKFLKSAGWHNGRVLYMDPDHVIVKPIAITPIPAGALLVSSELRPRISHSSTDIYNTSLIFGTIETWELVTHPWIDEYNAIKGFIPFRFREEIAFSRVARKLGVSLLPVSNVIQSNFYSFNADCMCFHYGGEYAEAKAIKGCLNQELVSRCLTMAKRRDWNVGGWIINEILQVLDTLENRNSIRLDASVPFGGNQCE